jgi:hypothetical protein
MKPSMVEPDNGVVCRKVGKNETEHGCVEPDNGVFVEKCSKHHALKAILLQRLWQLWFGIISQLL